MKVLTYLSPTTMGQTAGRELCPGVERVVQGSSTRGRHSIPAVAGPALLPNGSGAHYSANLETCSVLLLTVILRRFRSGGWAVNGEACGNHSLPLAKSSRDLCLQTRAACRPGSLCNPVHQASVHTEHTPSL